MTLHHRISLIRVRYGRILTRATLFLAGASLLVVLSMAAWFFFVEYNAAAARVAQAEQSRVEMEALLNGKLAMIEPVSDKYEKRGKVAVHWELVELRR